MRGLSLVAASGDHSSSRCASLSLSWPLLLRSTGSRRAGSVIVAHGPSCSTACGIFPDQGLNPCPLHWQADSQPLCHQGSPQHHFRHLLRPYKSAPISFADPMFIYAFQPTEWGPVPLHTLFLTLPLSVTVSCFPYTLNHINKSRQPSL